MRRETAAVVLCSYAAVFALTLAQPFCADDDAPVDAYVGAVSGHLDLIHAGDIVLVHPPWRDDVVQALRALPLPAGVTVTEAFAPVAQKDPGGGEWPAIVLVADPQWPLPAALRRRAADHLRALALTTSHDSAHDAADAADDDDVTIFRLAAAPQPRLLDVRAATVTVREPGGVDVACPWSPVRRRHVCAGLPEWMTVGEDTLRIGGTPEPCTWAHPKTGAVVVIDFGSVDMGGVDMGGVDIGGVDSSGLRLSLALSDGAADNPTGAAVTARLVVGDRQGAVTVQRERGFHSVDVGAEVVASRGARRLPVRVEITTDNDGQRHTCFRLVHVRAASPALPAVSGPPAIPGPTVQP